MLFSAYWERWLRTVGCVLQPASQAWAAQPRALLPWKAQVDFTRHFGSVRPAGWMRGGTRGCSQLPGQHPVGDEEQLFVTSCEAQPPLLDSAAEGRGWTDCRSPPHLDMDKRGMCGSGVARSRIMPRPREVLTPAPPASSAQLGSPGRYGARWQVWGECCSSSS